MPLYIYITIKYIYCQYSTNEKTGNLAETFLQRLNYGGNCAIIQTKPTTPIANSAGGAKREKYEVRFEQKNRCFDGRIGRIRQRDSQTAYSEPWVQGRRHRTKLR